MIPVGMGTTSVLPRRLEPAFLLARKAGFDGVEVMITSDPATQSARAISALSSRYGMPVLSIHAPVLLFSTLEFGRDPRTKLERAAALAAELGATTVIAHPPWRWQGRWAAKFEAAVAGIAAASGLAIAVENMFPVAAGAAPATPSPRTGTRASSPSTASCSTSRTRAWRASRRSTSPVSGALACITSTCATARRPTRAGAASTRISSRVGVGSRSPDSCGTSR